jgi:hypothetical protein
MSEISARICSGVEADAVFFRFGNGGLLVSVTAAFGLAEAGTTAFPSVVTAAEAFALRGAGYCISAQRILLASSSLFLARGREGGDGAIGFGFFFVFFVFFVCFLLALKVPEVRVEWSVGDVGIEDGVVTPGIEFGHSEVGAGGLPGVEQGGWRFCDPFAERGPGA